MPPRNFADLYIAALAALLCALGLALDAHHRPHRTETLDVR